VNAIDSLRTRPECDVADANELETPYYLSSLQVFRGRYASCRIESFYKKAFAMHLLPKELERELARIEVERVEGQNNDNAGGNFGLNLCNVCGEGLLGSKVSHHPAWRMAETKPSLTVVDIMPATRKTRERGIDMNFAIAAKVESTFELRVENERTRWTARWRDKGKKTKRGKIRCPCCSPFEVF
jgi:hypothetical protein